MLKSNVTSAEEPPLDVQEEQQLSFLESVLLYTIGVLLIILLFGKECFLVGSTTIFGQAQWFVLTGLAYVAKYGGIAIGASGIIIQIICHPRRNVLGYLFGGLFIWIAFCIYIALGTIVTAAPKDVLWHTDILYTYTLPVLALTAALLFFGRPSIYVLRNVIIAYSLLLALAMVASRGGVISSALADTEMTERFLEENVIGTARALYYCGFALAFWAFSTKQSLSTRIICALASLILVSAGFSTGSRGPLLAFLITMPLWIAIMRIKLLEKTLITAFVIFAVFLGWTLVQKYVPAASSHLSIGSDSGRNQFGYSIVLQSTPTLLGRGTGSFAQASSLIYPHNLFLEIYYEHGVFGLLFLLYLLGIVGYRLLILHFRNGDPYQLWILVSFVYFLLCAQFSGALVQQIGLWLFTIVGLRITMGMITQENTRISTYLRYIKTRIHEPISSPKEY